VRGRQDITLVVGVLGFAHLAFSVKFNYSNSAGRKLGALPLYGAENWTLWKLDQK